MSLRVRFSFNKFSSTLLTLALVAGCGEGPIGGEGFEKGLPVVDASALEKAGSTKVDFLDAPADVYEGGIQIWFYRGQPFTGWAKTKYPNGNVERKEFLQTGLMHGVTQTWYEAGQLKSEENWHYGLPDGLWVERHENGEILAVNYWQRGVVLIKLAWNENGVPVKIKGWDEDGTPIAPSG